MTISWASSDGQTGIAEDAYEFAMQHSEQPKTEEKPFSQLPESTNIEDRRGETPSWTDHLKNIMRQDPLLAPFARDDAWQTIKDTFSGTSSKPRNVPRLFTPIATGMAADMGSGAYDEPMITPAQETAIRQGRNIESLGPGGGAQIEGTQPTMHEQLATFQQRLDNTPPAEAGALQKFFGSLNIMPQPGKPQEEWTAKEHLGYMLNTAMGGMGGGYRMPKVTGPGFGARPPASFDYPMDFKDYYPANNANKKGGVTFREGEPLTTETIPQLQQAQHRGPNEPVPPKTMTTPAIEQLAKYEELSSQGKTTKQITKATKLAPEQVREALGRDNLAIAAFNSENALTNAYFKSLENLDPALGEALKKQVSVKDLKRYTRNLPEERLKTIFEDLPAHVKEAFESGEQRRINIDAGKKSKVIPKPLK